MRADNRGRPERAKLRTKRSGARKQTGQRKESSIDSIIKQIEEQLMKNMKPSVGDLVRLLELRRELTKTEPRKLTVQWVDQCPEPASGE
jgi:hypothetical protein